MNLSFENCEFRLNRRFVYGITGLVDQLVGENIALNAAAATVLPVEQAIAGTTSLEDLRSRLDALVKAPPPDALAQLYARADFIAGAWPQTPRAARHASGGPDGDTSQS